MIWPKIDMVCVILGCLCVILSYNVCVSVNQTVIYVRNIEESTGWF